MDTNSIQMCAPETVAEISGRDLHDPYQRFTRERDAINMNRMGSGNTPNSQYISGTPTSPSGMVSPNNPVQGLSNECGKTFFKLAKSKLTFDQFQEFLGCVRKLNSRQASRDDTLHEARRIFKTNKDLFDEFHSLLQKHERADAHASPC